MKQFFLLAVVCCATFAQMAVARRSNSHDWLSYKRQHGKIYETPEEDAYRFSLFMAAKENIRRHNEQENASYKLGLSHLSDWTSEELAKLNGFRYDAIKHQQQLEASKEDAFLRSILDDPTPIPAEVDWRKVPGRVTHVKDQGQCGSCWAFATTGLLEGQQLSGNTNGGLTALSEQELVDCSKLDHGCYGGIMSSALSDIARIGGIESEKDYPYIGYQWECHFNVSKVVMTNSGSIDLPSKDEVALKKVVANYGPVATAIMVTQKLIDYKSGIFSDPLCGSSVNHAVLVVGYGTDTKDGDYWIVKNSWAANWGDAGYFKIKRGTGMCGIGLLSTIAKFKN